MTSAGENAVTVVNVTDENDEGNVETVVLNEREKRCKQVYYKSIFDKYDSNKTGYIELNELREMLRNDDEVSKKIVKRVFDISDRNGDEHIDYNEFYAMIHNKKLKKIFGRYIDTYIRFVLPRNKCNRLASDEADGIYEDHYSLCPPPFAMILITAIELTCFITDEWTQKDSTITGSGVTAQLLIYDPTARQEFWRFLTYMFVHIGYAHLIVNMIVQLLLGLPLEMVHKWWRVSIVYILGVTAGSLLTSITDPTTYLAGASGGVYALLTAHVATIIMNWNEMTFPFLQLLVFLVLVVFDLGISIYNRYFLEIKDHIGYAAHFGGAVAGLLVGIWVLKNFIPSKRETCLWWFALIVFLLFMASMVLMNVAWKSHFLVT